MPEELEYVVQFEGDPEASIHEDFWAARDAMIERIIQFINTFQLQLAAWRWRFGSELTLLFSGPELKIEMWRWNPVTNKASLVPSYERDYIERALEAVLPVDPRNWSPRRQ